MDQPLQAIWSKVLAALQARVSKNSFDSWLQYTKATYFDDQKMIIGVPDLLTKDWIEMRYTDMISDIVYDITSKHVQIQTELHTESSPTAISVETFSNTSSAAQKNTSNGSNLNRPFVPPVQPPYSSSTQINEKDSISLNNDENGSFSLNPKYTFDTFVIGANNRFAHAAALAVAEQPAENYNPLFLYGGVGLGKTHLMHAIGHYFLDRNPSKRVMYISSEKFTNEFINAIMNNRGESFRNKYRNIDILLIDDIQFLAGKEQTQEEFFHTFNALHEEHKQIVISSDRPPKEIPTLEDRLRSRFEWGLITDIQPPDLETRIAILRKKAKAEQLDVANDVMIYIASQVDTNIRELEGALIRVVAYSSLINADISVQLAAEALKDIVSASRSKIISVNDIQQKVSEFYGVRLEDFKARKRTKSISLPRQVAMYLARELTEYSLPKIGEAFGGRDHTTVIHAYDKISESIKTDPELAKVIKTITEQIKNQLM